MTATGTNYKGGLKVAQKSHLLRRPSGVYVCRIVVPLRHRPTIGKNEVHQSTNTRDLPIAKLVSASVLAHWREKFLTLDRLMTDVKRLLEGSPLLSLDGHISVTSAAELSGLPTKDILKNALEGRWGLFYRSGGTWGHHSLKNASEVDIDDYGTPGNPSGPIDSAYDCVTGLQRVRALDMHAVVNGILSTGRAYVRIFESSFVSEDVITLTSDNLEVDRDLVNALRAKLATLVTPEQRKSALRPVDRSSSKAPNLKISSYLEKYLRAREEQGIKRDQLRQIRDAISLFIEVTKDPLSNDITKGIVEKYRDEFLPTAPSHEDKHRKRLNTSSVLETIQRLKDSDKSYESLSPEAIRKRMAWVSSFINWIGEQQSQNLDRVTTEGAARTKKRTKKNETERPPFGPEELTAMFSDPIFQNGKGKQTNTGTYKGFLPWHYWGLLIALYAGVRSNESCQLHVSDIIQIDGIWCFSIDSDDREDGASAKSMKTPSARRKIPIHQKLLDLGLIEWRDAVREAGYTQLFPEWKAHNTNGRFSPMASRWFSETFKRRTLPESTDPKKVLHSFRHNFNTALVNAHCPPSVVSQLMGHALVDASASKQTLQTYYHGPKTKTLQDAINSIEFDLPEIKPFDLKVGLQALSDAAGRKVANARRKGKGIGSPQ